jgi:hypothetical protein
MFPPRTIRSIVTCALACGLLATTTGTAAARPIDDARAGAPTSSLAGTTSDTPRQELRSTDASNAVCPPNLPDGATTSCLPATTTPRQDLRSPDARDAADAERIALAMEQYYSSYGEPEPIAPPASPP